MAVFNSMITISPEENRLAQRAIEWKEGNDPSYRLGENDTFVFTAVFGNGYQMDVKVCGVDYSCPEKDNSAWTEAVLFDEQGRELCRSDPDGFFLGRWELKDNGNIYAADVVVIDPDEM